MLLSFLSRLTVLQALTRIVAHDENYLPQAVNVINLATQMMNGQFKPARQIKRQQQQQQEAGIIAGQEQQQQQHEEQQQQHRVLVFQPLKVRDRGAAPAINLQNSICTCSGSCGRC
jgi:hypothetical protein